MHQNRWLSVSLSKGLGVGWRPQLAMHIERRKDLSFIELLADNHMMDKMPRKSIQYLVDSGLEVVIHSIGLSLGGASLPDDRYLEELNRVAALYNGKIFSEHIAFVRSGGLEAGHLLPVKRDESTLLVLVENINYACKRLSKPLVLENIASFLDWPGNTMSEVEFLSRILKETDCKLLLDVSNLYANSVNNKFDLLDFIDNIPTSRIEYLHIAGGISSKGIYHDTHSHNLNDEVLELLGLVCRKLSEPSVLLERDDLFPMQKEFFEELDSIEKAIYSPVEDFCHV